MQMGGPCILTVQARWKKGKAGRVPFIGHDLGYGLVSRVSKSWRVGAT